LKLYQIREQKPSQFLRFS